MKTGKPHRKTGFQKGCRPGPGRPKGCVSSTNGDLRVIKRQFAESWSRCNGAEILDDMAKRNPERWLTLIAGLLPKETDLSIMHDDVASRVEELKRDKSAAVHPETETMLDACRKRIGDGRPITHEVVMDQLEADLVKTNGKGRKRGT